MEIFGYEIIKKKDRDNNPYGKVMFNIQVREGGLTISSPDGVSAPNVGVDVDPRAWLLGHVEAERFTVDWDIVSKIPLSSVMEWVRLKSEYSASGIVAPATKALEDLTRVSKVDEGEMYR
jgi:hypothetical protein